MTAADPPSSPDPAVDRDADGDADRFAVEDPAARPPTGETPTTVLPEGRGGRPGVGRHARPPRTAGDYVRALLRRARAQAPLTVVLAVVVVAFWRIGLQYWREGTVLLGGALLLGAVFRAVLPGPVAGLLAVRPWRVDVVTYAVFGLVVIALALTITGGPLAVR